MKTQDFFFRTRTITRRICFLFLFSNKINVFAGFLIPSRLLKEITNISVGKKFLYFSLIIIINYDVTLNVLNHIRLWNKDMTWCNTAEKTWTLNLTEWQHRLLHMNIRLDLKKREALTHLWFCRNKLLFWWLVPRWLRGRLKARHAGSDWSPPLGLLGSGDRSAAAAWYLWSLITACRCSC